jgi:3-oxo-5-alpha-steroid 4-dehydrogenase 1
MDALTELQLHGWAVWLVFGSGALVLIALTWMVAPYGRHQRGGWGPMVSARTGWIVMEAPASLAWLFIYLRGDQASEWVPLLLLLVWQSHYIYRAFIYPLGLGKSAKRMPVSVVVMAIVFNLLNAYVNARWVSQLGEYPKEWLAEPRLWLGIGLFFFGMYINRRADRTLARLRRDNPTEYSVPRGWLYDYVASPNYFGEILQWTGWAIATWSLAGLSFAFFTLSNLAPRAISHLRWYRETFPDYPRTRRAIVPFVL